MKKYLLLCALAHITIIRTKTEHTSKSFLFSRPINQITIVGQALWHDLIYHTSPESKQALQWYLVHQHSIQSPRLSHYFLIDPCKNYITVAGDDAAGSDLRDVRAEWLGITNHDFFGRLSICPEQQQSGIFFDYYADLCDFFDIWFLKDYWISVSVPLVMVRNRLNMCQFDLFNHDAHSMDIIQALTSPDLLYGRFYTGNRRKIGVAEINIRLGKTYLACNDFEVIYYSGIRIPTSGSQDPHYIFDPFIGNNGHFGIQAGAQFQLKLTRDDEPYAVLFFTTLESSFLTRSHQTRTFDLTDKPWSRYMRFNVNQGPPDQLQPGTQILTLKARVRPYTMIDLAAGFRYKDEYMEAELGYSLWGHGNEKVRLLCKIPDNHYGIAGTGPDSNNRATSANDSTIAQQTGNDTKQDSCDCEIINDNFEAIWSSDIDLESAAAVSAINHRVHAAVHFVHRGECRQEFIGCGGFYEVPQKNTAFQLWGLWIKFGLTF